MNKVFFPFIYLFLITLVIYICTLPAQRFYVSNIVPFGDPFTYELSFYYLLETIDKQGYFEGFKRIFANWYWLQNTLVFIFSPILKKSTEYIVIINFFCYFLSSAAIYRYLKSNDFDKIKSLTLSSIIWIIPISYSFDEYTSLNTLGLDSSFIGCLIGLSFASLTYLNNPNSLKSNFYFFILFVMSFYGRGNSIFTVGLILFIPFIFFLKDYFFKKKLNFTIFAILFFLIIFFVCFFYFRVGSAILEYYKVHTYFYSEQKYDIGKALHYLLNIPGVFFYYPKPSVIDLKSDFSSLVTFLSIFINFLVICLSIIIFRIDKKKLFKVSTLSGLFIYFGTLIINVIMWQHPHINLYNAQLIFSPMRIGILIILINFLALYFNKISYKFLFLVPLILATNAYSNSEYFKTWKTTHGIKPYKIERVANYIYDNISESGNGYNILWYGDYNPNIFNFYRLRGDLPTLKLFYPKNYDNIWSQAQSDEIIDRTKKGLEQIFEGSDLIVLPSSSELFNNGRYSFYLNKDIFINILGENLNNFNIISEVKETNYTLYLLKRIENNENSSNIDLNIKNSDYYLSYKKHLIRIKTFQ